MSKLRSACFGAFLIFLVGLVVPVSALALDKELAPLKYKADITANIEQGQVTKGAFDKITLDNTTTWLSCAILGGCPEEVQDKAGLKKIKKSVGVVGDMTGYIAYMYTHPAADTQTYVADLLNSAGIAQPAYAQGFGFASLSPILNAWKTFRNLAYLFFVIIFLVIGFMIMFRQKIGGQTVVTAQQAIPQIIISLLFVTFSYAISGLLIEVMYLFMFLLVSLFGYTPDLIGNSFVDIGKILLLNGDTYNTAFQAVGNFVQNGLSGIPIQPAVDAIAILSGGIAVVVLAVAILIGIFRLFFELLKTYATIVISIVVSPLMLMMGAIPGRNVFGGWIKNLIGNLAAFPAVLMILIIYDQITGGLIQHRVSSLNHLNSPVIGQVEAQGAGNVNAIQNGGFVPPYLTDGSGNVQAMVFLLGLALLLAMTDIVIKVKQACGAKDDFAWFTNAVSGSLKKGWSGDAELIPGLGITNLKKSPLTNWFGGLSGENATRKAAVTGSTAAFGLAGGALGGLNKPFGGSILRGTFRGGRRAGQYVADNWKDEQLYTKYRKERQDPKSPRGYGDG